MSSNKRGFIMQSRGPEVDELMKDPFAFVLLTQIARRARRTHQFNRHNLKPGEALIGDHDSIGLTQANYRSAKRRLESYDLATFKPTNKGTVATLTDSTIYDINLDEGNKPNDKQATSSQQASNEPANNQPTTNNNDNNDNKANNGREDAHAKLFEILREIPVPAQLKKVSSFADAYLRYRIYLKDTAGRRPNEVEVETDYSKLLELMQDGNDPVKVIQQTIHAKAKSFFPLRDFDAKTPKPDDWDQRHLKRPAYREYKSEP